MGVDLRRAPANFAPMRILNLLCAPVLLFPFIASAAAGGAEGARVENFGAPVFGKAVKIGGVSPRAMALCVDGKTLYIGASHYLYVADISEPMNPRILGKVGGLGNVRQIAVQDGIAYVASRESGLWIVDARNPKSPKVLSRYDCIELATGIDVAGRVAFLGQRNNGVEFIDVSDPANPEHIRIIKTPESQSVKYRDGYLFSGEWHSGEVTVFDARDMADVKVVSRLKMDGYGDGIDLGGNLLFASTGHHSKDSGKAKEERFGGGHGLEIFDISDISNPRKISSVKFPKFYYIGNDFWTPRRSGNTVFAADTFNGLFAVDISDVKNPRIAGRITTPPKKEGAPSSPISSVAVADGAVYVSSLDYGVMAVECPNARASAEGKGVLPKNPSYRAQYPADSEKFFVWKPERSAQVRAVAVSGDTAYAACGAEGIAVLRLSGSGFEEIGRIKMPFAGDVKIRGGRLYAAEGQNGLAVYNIDPHSPAALSEAGRLKSLSPESSLVLWVWVPEGNFIAATDRVGGIFFIDARDLKNMKVAFRKGGCPGWNKYFSGGIVGGKYAGMSYANSRFEWFDLSGEKPVPANASYKNRPGVSNGCCVFRDKVLWTNRAGEVVLLGPNQPENPDGSAWKSVPVGGAKVSALPAWDGGRLVAFTNRIEKSVVLADFGDEKNPKAVWIEKISGNPDTPEFWRGRLIIPAGYGGLMMTRERF